MKKLMTAAIACALIPTAVLTACSPAPKTAPDNNAQDAPKPIAPIVTPDDKVIEPRGDVIIVPNDDICDILFDSVDKQPRPGVRRRFLPSLGGSYTLEYVHTPFGIDKDETLDYKLQLSDDNTFTMQVVTDGVSVDHTGHWYARRDEVMLYYDEQIDQPAHNEYVADSMYCDVLPQNKLMIYDNCRVIVLSRATTPSDGARK